MLLHYGLFLFFMGTFGICAKKAKKAIVVDYIMRIFEDLGLG